MGHVTSMFKMTCPKCHKGDMFYPLELKNPLHMHKQCAVCGQSFEPEPGFYYGAMFISYIFLGFFSLGFVGLFVFVFHWSVELSILLLITCLALMFFWNLRFSRSIWIHIVIRHDPRFEPLGEAPQKPLTP